MLQHRRLAASRRANHDDVGFLQLRVAIMIIAVLHALVMIVHGHRDHFLRPVLLDDVSIEELLYHVGLVFHDGRVKRRREIFLMLRLRFLVMLLNEIIYVLYAVPANRESRLRIEDRHIVLIAYRDEPLAKAAHMLHGHLVCQFYQFLSAEHTANIQHLISC